MSAGRGLAAKRSAVLRNQGPLYVQLQLVAIELAGWLEEGHHGDEMHGQMVDRLVSVNKTLERVRKE